MDKCAFLSCKFMLFLFVDLFISDCNYVANIPAYIFLKNLWGLWILGKINLWGLWNL